MKHRKEDAMSDYRFHLQKYRPGTKITCPECKKLRCFTRYIDEEGKIEFPDYVGRCDHEQSCGYNYTPKDFFHDNPDNKPNGYRDEAPIIYNKMAKPAEKTAPIPPSYIPVEIMEKSLTNYDTNPFFRYMCSLFGKEETLRIFQLYKVGTGKKWNGCTVFWQIDINQNIRTGKLMGYNAKTGKRIKEPVSQVTWAHAALGIKEYNLVQCLFGEHLLKLSPSTPVALVESEKTALIMTHYMPDFLWLATGGKDGCFNELAVQVLRDRTVVMIPDLGAWDKWQKKSQMLVAICKRVIVSDVIEEIATEEQRKAGLDVADFFLTKPTAYEILADMIRRNSSIKLLVEALDLEVCEDEVRIRSPTIRLHR